MVIGVTVSQEKENLSFAWVQHFVCSIVVKIVDLISLQSHKNQRGTGIFSTQGKPISGDLTA